jgi:hypothetical protein
VDEAGQRRLARGQSLGLLAQALQIGSQLATFSTVTAIIPPWTAPYRKAGAFQKGPDFLGVPPFLDYIGGPRETATVINHTG